jgi:hypothetical protein
MPGATDAFGPAALEAIIKDVLAADYTFARFDRPAGDSKRILRLRFDVDISPLAALLIGDLLHKHGVAATFFFQLNAGTYSAFSPPVLDAIDTLRARGHAVGLHIDQMLLGDDEDRIAATLDWFNTCCRTIDRVVSFHRPAPSVLGRTYTRFTSAYAPEYFSSECYLSDSRRSMAFRPRLAAWLKEGHSPIQLLLHPEWWEPLEDVAAVWQTLRARRLAELEEYALRNFGAVFTSVIKQ